MSNLQVVRVNKPVLNVSPFSKLSNNKTIYFSRTNVKVKITTLNLEGDLE